MKAWNPAKGWDRILGDEMIYQPDNRFLALIFCLVVLAVMSGCATGKGGQGSQDEMPAEMAEEAEAREGDEGSRLWHVEDEDEPEGGMGTEETTTESSPSPWNRVTVQYSRAHLDDESPPGFDIYTFALSSHNGANNRIFIGAYFGEGRASNGREIKDDFRWVTEIGFDVWARTYVPSDSSLFGIFGMLGVRAGGQFWSYTQAVEATDGSGDTDFYSHDAAVVFTPYMGAGVSLLQNKVVCLGINASAGYRLFGDRTYHDLEVVSFRNVFEYKVNFELTFSFE